MNLLDTLKELGGYWHYEGGKYLAKLTSGKVSDTYANLSVLTCRPTVLGEVVRRLLQDVSIEKKCPDCRPLHNGDPDCRTCHGTGLVPAFDWESTYVCGPAMGGVTLAYEVARQLGATAIFTEPVYDSNKSMCVSAGHTGFTGLIPPIKTGQQLKRFEIPEGATILFVEDVITTGKSTREMIDAAMVNKPPYVKALEYVLCLVNRSGSDTLVVEDKGTEKANRDLGLNKPTSVELKIISLAEINATTWDSVDAVYGTKWHDSMGQPALEAVRPKENWDLLPKGV